MKLNTSKITDGVAVHCPKKEYVRPLFEAMNWHGVDTAEARWIIYKERTCFSIDKKGWSFSDKERYEEFMYRIIPFEDLIIHEESKEERNLAKFLSVKEDEPFKIVGFDNHKFRIHSNQLESRYLSHEWHLGSLSVNELINAEIKPLPRWTPEEQKMAEKDSFRFGWVARDKTDIIHLFADKPHIHELGYFTYSPKQSADYIIIPDTDYPSLQPGECVSLEEIAGGGE